MSIAASRLLQTTHGLISTRGLTLVKIEVTWNKPDGTKPTMGFAVNPNDPHLNDEEMQIHKAVAGAQAHFHQKFGEAPSVDQLTTVVIKTMTADAFKKTALRTETDATITYDVRPFGGEQQEAVAVYLGELVFKLSINALQPTKAVVLLADHRFVSTPQLDGFIEKLSAAGLAVTIQT